MPENYTYIYTLDIFKTPYGPPHPQSPKTTPATKKFPQT